MGLATAATFAAVAVGALATKKLLKPPPLPALPPVPQRDDPATQTVVAEAKKKERMTILRRKGRSSTILTGGAGVVGDAPLSQPQALGG